MNVVIAIDSFKGSLSSIQGANAIKDGILKVYPDAYIEICPMADGGEGTTEAIVTSNNGRYEQSFCPSPPPLHTAVPRRAGKSP